jgi:hypothetical protein
VVWPPQAQGIGAAVGVRAGDDQRVRRDVARRKGGPDLGDVVVVQSDQVAGHQHRGALAEPQRQGAGVQVGMHRRRAAVALEAGQEHRALAEGRGDGAGGGAGKKH